MRRAPAGTRPSRRQFLGLTGAGTAAVMLGTGAWPTIEASAAPFGGYPFTLGVASGDPLPTSVVLWTRLAVDPFAPDGHGGMGNRPIPVRYQLAEDEGFRRIVRRGVVLATPELGHSVHPEIGGLEPGREYHYRFLAGREISPVGRTKTAPAPGSKVDRLTFAFASCQSYEGGYYTAYQHMAQEDLDLIVHLGDYIYEESYVEDPQLHEGGPLPEHMRDECLDLRQYRMQYGLYKSDQHLQAAHAMCPWVHTFDDHEVENNWRAIGSEPDDEPDQDPEVFLKRRADAFQAMYENQPLRSTQMPAGPGIRMHRRIGYGSLADFTMIDSHQFRSQFDSFSDPDATNLGIAQRDWLVDGFSSSTAQWQIIGNQQPMAARDTDPDPEVEKFSGAWDAYSVEREYVLTQARERGAENLVVITGDRHSNYVMDLKSDYNDPESPVVGAEFVGTSISSNRDGADMLPVGLDYLAANPHMQFCNFQRGYSRVTVTPDTFTNDFRVVPYVSQPNAPISTRASYVVENGKAGAVSA